MPRRNNPTRRVRRVVGPPPVDETPGRREDGETLARALVRAGRASVDILERRDSYGPPEGTAGPLEVHPLADVLRADTTTDHRPDRSTHA